VKKAEKAKKKRKKVEKNEKNEKIDLNFASLCFASKQKFKGLGGLMPLFFTLLAFLSYIQYIHTFLHP
jgi:hypothetical protein